MNGRAEEAERWLRIALEGGLLCTHLQLAHVDFDMEREEEALAHLKLYLAWCVEGARGQCEGCGHDKANYTMTRPTIRLVMRSVLHTCTFTCTHINCV